MKTDRPILSIETAIRGGSICIYGPEGALAEYKGGEKNLKAEDLLSDIDGLLTSSGSKLRDLSAIAVSTGPGSYTGIRIGIATALGLGRAEGIEVRGVTILESLAGAAGMDGRIAVMVSVRPGEAAWQCFETGPHGPTPKSEARMASEVEVLREVTQDNPTAIICDYDSYKMSFAGIIGDQTGLRILPSDWSLARIVAVAAARGMGSIPEPLYLSAAAGRSGPV